MEIDHQVAIDVTQANHRAAGKHIQHHLLRGAGFHASRSGDDLRANLGDDCQVRGLFQRRIAVAGDGNCLGAVATSIRNCSYGERSAATGGDPHHYVIFAWLFLCDLAPAEFSRILVGFYRGA